MAAQQAKPNDPAFDPEAAISPSRALTPYAVRLNTMVVKAGFWPKIRKLALHIPFAEDALAMFFCAIDKETPAATKAILLAALAYFVLPTDAFPDWIPGLGFTDDAAVLAAALAATNRSIKPRHREQAKRQLSRIAGEPAVLTDIPA
ncbi:YkvA family protein [soil metagenome]